MSARQRPFRLTAPVVREHPLQKTICDVLRLEIAPAGKVSGWGVCWWCVDHANYGGEVPGIRLDRGIIAGIPDLFLLWRGRAYFVEIKATDGGLSAPQQAVMSAILAGGGHAGVACSDLDVLRLLDAWHIPRSGRTNLVKVAAA